MTDNQTTLDLGPAADPAPSRAAYAEILGNPSRSELLRAMILLHLTVNGARSFRRLEDAFATRSLSTVYGDVKFGPSAVRTRTNELVKLGLVQSLGARRDPSPGGPWRNMWAATDTGAALVHQYYRELAGLAVDPALEYTPSGARPRLFGTVGPVLNSGKVTVTVNMLGLTPEEVAALECRDVWVTLEAR